MRIVPGPDAWSQRSIPRILRTIVALLLSSTYHLAGCRRSEPEPPVARRATPEVKVALGRVDLAGLLDRMLPAPADPNPVLRDAREKLLRTSGAERALLQRAISLVEKGATRSGLAFATITGETVQLLRDWAAAYPRDMEVQRKVAETLLGMAKALDRKPASPGDAEVEGKVARTLLDALRGKPPGTALCADGIRYYHEAIRAFPGDVARYSNLAHAVLYCDGDGLIGLRAAKRCLELEPPYHGCSFIHAMLISLYERPYCEGDALAKDLQLLHGWTEQRAIPEGVSTRELHHEGKTLHVDRWPVIVASDVARVSGEAWGSIICGVAPAFDHIKLKLKNHVTENRLAPLLSWTPEERAVLVLGDRVVAISEPGEREMLSDNGLYLLGEIDPICARVEQRPVPPELGGRRSGSDLRRLRGRRSRRPCGHASD